MGEFAVSTDIRAPVDQVWSRLADIGAIAEWNPGVQESYVTNNQTHGVGACRRCNLGGSNTLDEEVVAFDANREIIFRITRTNLPFERADIRFELQSPSATTTKVTCSPVYKLKYGFLGQVLDKVAVQRQYRNGMQNLLSGLKKDLEQ